MSRRIVQIAAVDAPYDQGNGPSVFALDNNGVAWVMWGPRATWVRLPPLPSIDNPRPRPSSNPELADT